MRNPRKVLSKAQILDRVWNYDFGGQANVVELYISYLRKKIDAGRAPMIHTLRGAGYLLKPAEDPVLSRRTGSRRTAGPGTMRIPGPPRTLRARLLVALVALLAAVSAVVGLVSVLALDRFLSTGSTAS